MRLDTWGRCEETMRTRSGCSTYYMRCWLRHLQCSQSCRHTLYPCLCYLQEVLIVTLLNSSIKSLLSYPLPLAILLNSYINSSIVLLSCFSLFNSAILFASSFPSQTISLDLLEILLLLYNSVNLFSNLLWYFLFTHLLILSLYKIIPTLPISLLSHFSSSF